MQRIKSTKRALLASVLALSLCFAMLVGTTFAWFTDTASSENNIIKTGTLNVEMYWADGTKAVPTDDAGWTDASTGAIFYETNWEPGFVQVRHIKIANLGTLALQYRVNIVANGEVSKLSDVIDVYYVDPAVCVADRTALTAVDKIGTLTEVLAGMGDTASGMLAAGASDTVTIALKMQETANNDYQQLSIGSDFSVQLLATQVASEFDGFDNQYDKDAIMPATGSLTRTETGEQETITAGAVSVCIDEDAPAGDYQLLVTNISETTDENGDTQISMDIDLLCDGAKVAAGANDYGVSVNIGSGRVVTGMTHKGVAVESYSYNPSTGMITFETDSFSPFAFSYSSNVVSVGTAQELIDVLTEIRTVAKTVFSGETGNKAYRENVTIVLENDIVVDSSESFMYTDSNGAPFHFYGVRGVLDLNGHSITVTETALKEGKTYANAVLLFQYSNVDIIGEGSVIAANQSIPVYAWANGSVNIYGGNYVSNASNRNESLVYVNNDSITVNVYGGTYTDSAYAFNVKDTCTKTLMILHEGITYSDFFKGTIDLTANDISKARIALAEGCVLSEYDENGVAMNKVVAK